MKLIPLGQSVINVAKPRIVIAWILALAKNKNKKELKMITVQWHRHPLLEPPFPAEAFC